MSYKHDKQKIIFKGPLSEMLYSLLEQYAHGVSTEDIESNERAVSLVAGDNGKELVVHTTNINTIIVFGVDTSTISVEYIAQFLSLFVSLKRGTEIRLLILDSRAMNEQAQVLLPILINLCSKMKTKLYTSFEHLINEALGE